MSPSNRDIFNFLDAHDIAFNELTLEEKHLVRQDNITKLKQCLEQRGRLLCPGLQLKPDNSNIADVIDQDIFEQLADGPLTPENDRLEIAEWEIDWPEWDGVLPPDAEIFFDDGEYAFYRTDGGAQIYVTESQSDPVPTDEDDAQIRKMIRVLDNMAGVMDEIRSMLVRML